MNKAARLLLGLEIAAVIYLLIAIGLGLMWGANDFVIGVAVGGLIAIPNFELWRWVVNQLIKSAQSSDGQKSSSAAGKFILKNALPLLAIGVAIFAFHIDPIGLTVGLS